METISKISSKYFDNIDRLWILLGLTLRRISILLRPEFRFAWKVKTDFRLAKVKKTSEVIVITNEVFVITKANRLIKNGIHLVQNRKSIKDRYYCSWTPSWLSWTWDSVAYDSFSCWKFWYCCRLLMKAFKFSA